MKQLVLSNSGLRRICELTGLSINTVLRYHARFGEPLCALHDELVRGVRPVRIQLDEAWSWVYAKRESKVGRTVLRDRNGRPLRDGKGRIRTAKIVSPRAPVLEKRGEFYLWVAFDPDTKLVISYHTGRRTMEAGHALVNDLWARIIGRPFITTDAFQAYPELLERAFGTEVDHVMLEKEIKGWHNPETRDSGQHVVKIEKLPQNGTDVSLKLASTSQLERFNGTVRDFNTRFIRKTKKFSKRLENHVNALHLFMIYYNFMKPHRGLKEQHKGWTPAMAAGVSKKIWSFEDLLEYIDRYWARKEMRPKLGVVPPTPLKPLAKGATSEKPYFVMHSLRKHDAKVHKADCRNCRKGLGRGEAAATTVWYAFESERSALEHARTLAPMQYSVCSICVIGRYAGNQVRQQNSHGAKDRQK